MKRYVSILNKRVYWLRKTVRKNRVKDVGPTRMHGEYRVSGFYTQLASNGIRTRVFKFTI